MVSARGVRKTFRPAASLRLLLRGRLRGEPVVALDGVDLEAARGEIVGLMGPNGAGKSTLLRILAGLVVASEGTVRVCGLDAARGGAKLARAIGWVSADERGLTPYLSPREHVAFFAALHGLARSEALARADALVEELGLAEVARRPMRELSTGQRRRVTLARGLVGAPEVLLLDEPTRGLDPIGADALRARFAAAAKAGATIVLATHDRFEAERLCARVAVLDGGRVAAIGPPAVVGQWLNQFPNGSTSGANG